MRKEVTKMNYDDTISVRDYEVSACIRNKESMEIIHKGERMTLSVEQLENDVKGFSPKLKSKIAGGKDYRLYNYVWNPIEVEL
jgi:hypothetical protein